MPPAASGETLATEDRADLAAIEGAGPFGPAELPMGGYLSLPASWRDQPETAADWIGKALSNGRTFPPKKKQPKKG